MQELIETRRRVVQNVGKLVKTELGQDLLRNTAEPKIRRTEATHSRPEPRDSLIGLDLHCHQCWASCHRHWNAPGDILHQCIAERVRRICADDKSIEATIRECHRQGR